MLITYTTCIWQCRIEGGGSAGVLQHQCITRAPSFGGQQLVGVVSWL